MLIFLFSVVHFHTAIFASEPKIVNDATRVLRSSIHWFIHSTVPEFILDPDREQLFSWVPVRLFGPHPSAIHTPAQKIHTKGGNELEFDSIEPYKTGVNTP